MGAVCPPRAATAATRAPIGFAKQNITQDSSHTQKPNYCFPCPIDSVIFISSQVRKKIQGYQKQMHKKNISAIKRQILKDNGKTSSQTTPSIYTESLTSDKTRIFR